MKSNSLQLRKNNPRGSVLILVVAVLVLLALMGSAFIAVARVDSTRINDNTTGGAVTAGSYAFGPTNKSKADDLLKTVSDQALNAIINDLFNDTAKLQYRQDTGATYKPYDFVDCNPADPANIVGLKSDKFLASRLPERLSAGVPYWPVVTGKLRAAPLDYFSSPGSGTGLDSNGRLNFSTSGNEIRPWSVIISGSRLLTGYDPNPRTRVYPAFNVGGTIKIAADTDLDGIADAWLFAIDVDNSLMLDGADRQSDVNGTSITYYGAIRVVDNCSGINVNTAFSRGGDYSAGPSGATPVLSDPYNGADLPNYGFFRSNVGLIEMLSDSGDLTNLVQRRFGGLSYVDSTPYVDGAARNDFQYISVGDSLEMNVARRPRNPGDNGTQTMGVFDPKETAPALKYHGVLLDPSSSRVSLERTLSTATQKSVSNYGTSVQKMFQYYPADKYNNWFQYNLDYEPANTLPVNQVDPDGRALSIRGLLSSTSAVTNYVPAMSMAALDANVKSATPTTASDPVQKMTDWGDPGAPGNTSAGYIGKVSANTASFADLWRAYWQVMADPSAPLNPETPGSPATIFNVGIMRGSGALTQSQLMFLRAAIAAVNTEDLRDYDEDVTVRSIGLPGGGISAKVYGTEKQAFITRAEVDPDGTTRIRVFNPFKLARTFPFLRLAKVDRTGPGGTLVVTDITASVPTFSVARGSIAAESETSLITIPSSVSIVGAELYLMRTPKAVATGAETPDELVPLDQLDLRGIALGGSAYVYQRNQGPGLAWKCVYPGEYDPAAVPRHKAMGVSPTVLSIPERTIQLNNTGFPGPVQAAGVYAFPFNGFARDGDLLQVPFVGAYRIIDGAAGVGNAYEMNSVTMDVAIASSLTANDSTEQIGRFCGDLAGYDWASDLFDYVTTTQNPRDDALPNIATAAYAGAGTAPVAISNEGASANVNEDASPVEGRININTAPWRVLAMLPLAVDPTTGKINKAGTETIATAIVANRQASGPFTSLFDLNKRVSAFQQMNGLITATYNPGAALGDLTPAPAAYPSPTGAVDDGVAGDFESRYVQLNRISNLVTTRSDSFTVYVLVQGWRDADQLVTAGTNAPRLVIEKRAAYVVDRSGIRANKSATTDLRMDGK